MFLSHVVIRKVFYFFRAANEIYYGDNNGNFQKNCIEPPHSIAPLLTEIKTFFRQIWKSFFFNLIIFRRLSNVLNEILKLFFLFLASAEKLEISQRALRKTFSWLNCFVIFPRDGLESERKANANLRVHDDSDLILTLIEIGFFIG